MLKSFPAAVDSRTKILVVGSMPGEASLKAGEYYAYKYNHFWPIIFTLFNKGESILDYQAKLNLLLSNNIGLWDSLKYCSRSGSLDKDIKLGRPNNFKALFKKYPSIKRVVFNGTAAYKFFKQFNDFQSDFDYLQIPSTSPANASKSFEEKLSIWRKALL